MNQLTGQIPASITQLTDISKLISSCLRSFLPIRYLTEPQLSLSPTLIANLNFERNIGITGPIPDNIGNLDALGK